MKTLASFHLASFLLLAATVAACKGGDATSTSADKAAASGAANPGAANPAAAAQAPKAGAAQVLKIDDLKLQLEAAGAQGGAEKLGSQYIVSLADNTPVSITAEPLSKTFKDNVEKAEMYTATSGKITQKEETADGWIVQYNNTGALGANYFVDVVRTIGGQKIECGSMASSQAAADTVAKICASIKPLS